MTERPGRRVPPDTSIRESVVASDLAAVRTIVEATEFFSAEEASIAVELVEERLNRGPDSGYEFLVAEREGALTGYACYGRTPGTLASWDLYWIVVAPAFQRHGIGRYLLAETERRIRAAGGRRVYIETSSRPQYEPTRQFYIANGYRQEAFLPDFYAPGDGKLVYCAVFEP